MLKLGLLAEFILFGVVILMVLIASLDRFERKFWFDEQGICLLVWWVFTISPLLPLWFKVYRGDREIHTALLVVAGFAFAIQAICGAFALIMLVLLGSWMKVQLPFVLAALTGLLGLVNFIALIVHSNQSLNHHIPPTPKEPEDIEKEPEDIETSGDWDEAKNRKEKPNGGQRSRGDE